MKKSTSSLLSILLVLCMVLTLLPGTALAADSGTCGDNMTWSLVNGTLTISGTGKMTEFGADWRGRSLTPWRGQAGEITSIVIENGVTTIADYVFQSCTITGMTIPGSVTTIGARAFETCRSLTSVIIPAGVNEIGHHAFWYCTSLTSVNIPSSVTSIGVAAFMGSGLTSVTVPGSVTTIEGVFSGCYSLTSVTILDGVANIGVSAFDGCSSLKSVTIPNTVTTIGDFAFSGCESLTNVKIPDSVTSIGEKAFGLCYNLKNVTIPASVTTIGGNAFVGDAFGRVPWLDSLGEFPIVNGMLLAYQGNGGAVTIPNGITRINDDAFWEFYYWDYYENRNVTSVTIPDSVTSIGKRAFAYCRDLTSVTIPASVTSIERAAFSDCDNLTDIYYGGSKSQWKQIDIDSSPMWDEDENGNANAPLLTATIHYAVDDTPSFKIELSAQNLTVDDKENVACEKYNIDDRNYFKLRDLAELLNGTGSQFEVGFDNATGIVSITTGVPYTKRNGTELVLRGDLSAKAVVSPQTIQINGVKYDNLKVYNIDGVNFFQLRELGDLLGFNVSYDEVTKTAIVRSVKK